MCPSWGCLTRDSHIHWGGSMGVSNFMKMEIYRPSLYSPFSSKHASDICAMVQSPIIFPSWGVVINFVGMFMLWDGWLYRIYLPQAMFWPWHISDLVYGIRLVVYMLHPYTSSERQIFGFCVPLRLFSVSLRCWSSDGIAGKMVPRWAHWSSLRGNRRSPESLDLVAGITSISSVKWWNILKHPSSWPL